MNSRAAPHRGIDAHYGDADDARPSKSELKRRSLDLQTLGEELAALSAEALGRIEMPEALREGLLTLQRTRSHEGRRRQQQYVGKLMRSADEAVLRDAVSAATVGSARETLLLHEAERWRAQLVADDSAIGAWIAAFPASDAQHLRSLVRAARRDAAAPEAAGQAARRGKSWRELFQFIKPHLTVST